MIRVRATKDGLKCAFVDAQNDRMIEKAEAILGAFHQGIGGTRAAIEEALAEVEGDGIDHKLTRGLAKLCFDRAEFETTTPIPPLDLRKAIFGLAARVGPVRPVAPSSEPASDPEGDPPRTAFALWKQLGTELGADPAALEAGLYADLPSEQTLLSFDVPGAPWLLHRYNVGLLRLREALQLRACAARSW